MSAELVACALPVTDITGTVIDALKCNARVPFDRLSIVARDGIVILSGHVNWKYESIAAASTAASVPGVAGVDNQIVVDIA
jgi:osmotically-inducible protein OsmY